MERRIKLAVTEKQLRRIMAALEEYFRLRMGQTWDFADDICLQGLDLSGLDRDKKFDSFITRRDEFRERMKDLILRIGVEGDRTRLRKTEEMLEMIDVWHVIRHWLWEQLPAEKKSDWTVDADAVYPESQEPLPDINWEEE